jgi:hypothetical protein
MAPSPSSPQRNLSPMLLSSRNQTAQEDDQIIKGIPPFDEAGAGGFNNLGDDDEDSNLDDDISVSGSDSSSIKMKSGGSESSPSNRSSSGESSGPTGVLSRIAGHGNEEDRRICGARCLFFLVLIVAAVSLGTMVFMITSRDANNDFEEEVRDH